METSIYKNAFESGANSRLRGVKLNEVHWNYETEMYRKDWRKGWKFMDRLLICQALRLAEASESASKEKT